MARFLIRAYSEASLGSRTIAGPGYKEIEGPLPETVDIGGYDSGSRTIVPRLSAACWVPWGLTADKRVVYAPIAEARGRATGPGLVPYTREVSQERRGLCHTTLGLIALRRTEFSQTAVQRVSAGILRFLSRRFWADHSLGKAGATKEIYAKGVGKYLYGTSYLSFGRISDSDASTDQMWHDAFAVLVRGKPLETVLNIHDGVGRAFFAPDDKGQVKARNDGDCAEYTRWYNLLRADKAGEFFHTVEVGPEGAKKKVMPWRGREQKAKGAYKASKLPGNLRIGTPLLRGLIELQERNRGVDMYDRIQPAPAPDNYQGSAAASGNRYFQDLDIWNELFGAGPSGTTGTALSAGFAFGKFGPRENLEKTREYLFAVIGYLVGGGMHTLNESLAILRLLGLEYNIGTLRGYDYSNSPNPVGTAPVRGQGMPILAKVTQNYPLLPQKFLISPEFRAWRDEFYDIVVLGGTHWRHSS